MIYESLKTLHLLSIVVWVGGMIFSHFFLRPAVSGLEPPVRLTLMRNVLGRFFQAVLVVSLLTLISGVWMLGRVAKNAVQSGAGFQMPFDWALMTVLGIVMVVVFLHIRFALFKRLNRCVNASDWVAGGVALDQIRKWVFVNLLLGVVILLYVLLV
jgi:uncharacterized membrane protein